MEQGTRLLVTVQVLMFVLVWLTAAMPRKLEHLHSFWKSNIVKRHDVSQLGSEILEMIQELKTQQQQFETVLNNLNVSVYSLLNPPPNIRLVEGRSPFEGRVEVFYNGTWGTICDDSWDERDARVVCRQLGYSSGVARSNAYFGRGEEPTWLDDVRCDGNETRIQECQSSLWGNENCNHGEDAGVECTDPSLPSIPPTTPRPQVSLRLVGGSSNSSGRLEVYHNGVWGTVCDDDFDSRDVRVACRQLGFSYNGNQRIKAFAAGSGTIWMDNLACSGNESALSDCSFNGWGNGNCDHSEDVGIECEGEDVTTPLPQQPATLNLVGGPSNSSGLLQVFHDGVWGIVCDDDFDSRDIRVACRQLEFSNNGNQRIKKFGAGSGTIWMDNLACSGNESALSDCSFNGWGNGNCDHSEDVGIECEGEDVTTPLPQQPAALRLTGGSTNSSGRLEVYHEGVWGTVCEDKFDSLDVRVACRQLGFSNNGNHTMKTYGAGSGTIWMDDLACSGNESALSECPFNGWGNQNCRHTEDVGIECEREEVTTPLPQQPAALRLVGGSTKSSGRLEVYHDGVWGTVCDDEFDSRDVRVACRQLGFSNDGNQRILPFGPGSGTTWMDGLACSGNESALSDCSFNELIVMKKRSHHSKQIKLDWLEVAHHTREDWSIISMENGERFAMTIGQKQTPE
ncbi:scavenger receptor cysteine-rich domain-containing protein DMBT1-like [Argopecten irradians]|uniref:scavenger receptor cysteine-rich domain-containing protein DMBT1-like n=1 Tax=Argopecten irradians TaxID=31199 RepID=UPI003710EF74